MKAAGGKPTPAIQTQYEAYQKAGQDGQAELQRLGQPIALANAYVEEQISAKLSDALKSAMTKAKVDLILRSEEHTSELQSLMRISYAAFCLKKQNEQPTSRKK